MSPEDKAKLRADAVFFAEKPKDDMNFDTWEINNFAKAVLEYINYSKYGNVKTD